MKNVKQLVAAAAAMMLGGGIAAGAPHSGSVPSGNRHLGAQLSGKRRSFLGGDVTLNQRQRRKRARQVRRAWGRSR